MKKILLLFILFIHLTNGYSQQRYAYLPEGKTFFRTSYEKLIIEYKGVLNTNKLKAFTTDSSLNKNTISQKWNIFDLKGTYRNNDSLVNVLTELRSDSNVLYANPFLVYSDGTLEGLTNQLIVRLKTSTNIDSLTSIFKQLNIIGMDKDTYINREYILTIKTNRQLDALDVADRLFETGLFDYCEPDFVKLGMFKTLDPVYNLQWGVHNTGQYNGTPGADVNVTNAWNIATGTGIRVAVIDEGVDLNQPDLQANLIGGFDALGLGSNGAPSGDDAHGTACAGIISAVANNNIGVTGIAYNSRIIPVRAGTGGAITTTAAVNAINWAASGTGGNADILSCSWGGGSSSASLNTAIANAISNGRNGLGCIVLFSSGDANVSNISYPSNQPNVISVGGTNMCDQRIIVTPTTPPNSCNYDTRLNTVAINGASSYGTGLGIVAPGINIATTDITGAAGFSNIPGQGWIMFNQDYIENFDGTSASCPFAAGVMALILSVNPNLTYSQATAILESTADKVGGYNYSTQLTNGNWNNEMGYGRVNACRALTQALNGVLNISGDASFCTTSNPYTISNLPTGSTVSWSTTPVGIATPGTPNQAQTTLAKNSNGIIILTATISNVCGGQVVINKSNIVVGTPSVPNMHAIQLGGSCYYDIAVDLSAPGTVVEFSPDGVNWAQGAYSNGAYKAGLFLLGPGYQLEYARTSNSCGKGTASSKNVYIPAPTGRCQQIVNGAPGTNERISNNLNQKLATVDHIKVYPNPADKKLVIELPVLSPNTQANIYNNEGKLMLSQKLYNKTSEVDISNFKTGIYLIRVLTDNGDVSTLKIIKE